MVALQPEKPEEHELRKGRSNLIFLKLISIFIFVYLTDKRVEAILEGDNKSVNLVIEWARTGPANSRVDNIEVSNEEFKNEFSTFEVLY